jgi:hypothetical protein
MIPDKHAQFWYGLGAGATAMWALIGFPLGIFIAGDGHALLSFGVYLIMCVMLGTAVTLWAFADIFGTQQLPREVEAE